MTLGGVTLGASTLGGTTTGGSTLGAAGSFRPKEAPIPRLGSLSTTGGAAGGVKSGSSWAVGTASGEASTGGGASAALDGASAGAGSSWAASSSAEADALSAQFNMLRCSTIGLLGVGAAGLGVGYFVTDDTALLVSPAGVGLTGRF